MISDFKKYLAQTSPSPMGLEVSHGKGPYLFDQAGKGYLDFIGGIGVSVLGHSYGPLVSAVKRQADKYLHAMVYGEFVLEKQVQVAKGVCELTDFDFNHVYLVNSGSEAVECALKVARKFTKRQRTVCFSNAYHGSTQGALSLSGNDVLKEGYGINTDEVDILEFNKIKDLSRINKAVAAVFVEPVQGEAGVIKADVDFLKAVRKACDESGALLIFDEVQTGFGKLGDAFAYQAYGVMPDILVVGKGFSAGLPLGGVVSSYDILKVFQSDPVLGHITTFGGSPLACAAADVVIKFLKGEGQMMANNVALLMEREAAKLPGKIEVRQAGTMMALDFKSEKKCLSVVAGCLEQGLITDWFLFSATSLRICPPFTITESDLVKGFEIIKRVLKKY